MSVKTNEIYSEVYSVLNMLGKNYIEKLPASLYNLIIEEKNNNYNPNYVENVSLTKQNISRESIAMIALFHLNYWCNTKEEKEKLRKIFNDNEQKYQVELKEKYNPDNIFKGRKKENIVQQEVAMVEYKETFWKRIFNKIKKISILFKS